MAAKRARISLPPIPPSLCVCVFIYPAPFLGGHAVSVAIAGAVAVAGRAALAEVRTLATH